MARKKEKLKIFFSYLLIAVLGIIIGFDIKSVRDFRNGYNELFIDTSTEELRQDITLDEIEALENQWKNIVGNGDLDKFNTLNKIKLDIEK